MHGLKVKCSYQGVKKKCGNGYHKTEKENSRDEYSCTKTTFQDYRETFKSNNPGIPLTMMGMATDDDSIHDDNSSEMKNTNKENNNENDNEGTYFNYNYSYDFKPY